eukprot:gene9854-13256_t
MQKAKTKGEQKLKKAKKSDENATLRYLALVWVGLRHAYLNESFLTLLEAERLIQKLHQIFSYDKLCPIPIIILDLGGDIIFVNKNHLWKKYQSLIEYLNDTDSVLFSEKAENINIAAGNDGVDILSKMAVEISLDTKCRSFQSFIFENKICVAPQIVDVNDLCKCTKFETIDFYGIFSEMIRANGLDTLLGLNAVDYPDSLVLNFNEVFFQTVGLPCFAGWLLGYPCLYRDVSTLEMDNMISISLVKFSVLVNVRYADQDENKSSILRAVFGLENKLIDLMEFSVPEKLLDNCVFRELLLENIRLIKSQSIDSYCKLMETEKNIVFSDLVVESKLFSVASLNL